MDMCTQIAPLVVGFGEWYLYLYLTMIDTGEAFAIG